MIPATTFAGKTVALFGLGGSGLATALALKTEALELARGIDDPMVVAMILDDTASIHAAEGDLGPVALHEPRRAQGRRGHP